VLLWNRIGLDLLSFSQFQSYVGRRVKEIEQQTVKMQAKIEAQRLVVLEAERKVKLLERLRERKLQDWKLECDRELENLASDSHLARLAASASASRALEKAALTL
jgi:flagellar biosynthesis chaperone FliJ